MLDFIASYVYGWFVDIFGYKLDGYLYGFCETGALYVQSFIYLVLITAIGTTLYYRVYINSSRNSLKHWFFFALVTMVIVGVATFLPPYNHLNNGMVCLDYEYFTQDVVMFGILNAVLSFIGFFLLSFPLSHWSKNKTGRNTPRLIGWILDKFRNKR